MANAKTRYTETDVSGTTLRISFSEPVVERRATEVRDWLRTVAADVAKVSGRFPLSRLDVSIVSRRYGGRGNGSPVLFGRVTRYGTEGVQLFIDPDRPIDEFYSDWVATHEFSHLLLPAVSWRQRWISEGFASYYQNVLMARGGHYTTAVALRKLRQGFGRGRTSQPGASPNEAARQGMSRARYKIYWSGAAIALLADVRLREQSGGRESLDVILGRFQDCCLPSRRRWSGEELFRKLDSLGTEPVFMPLYRQYADSPGFPDIDAALASPLVHDIFAVRSSTN